MDCVEYLSYWLLADILVIDHLINILVIDYLLNISFSLFSLCSWALLSLMVWLRACSDNRSAYSLWENLAPCSTMEESISCWRKKSKSNKEIIYRFSSRSQLQNIPHKAEILRFYKIEMQCFHKRGFLRLSLTDFANILAINKTKETSLVKTLAWTRLHADKMIWSSSQNSNLATIPCGISCHWVSTYSLTPRTKCRWWLFNENNVQTTRTAVKGKWSGTYFRVRVQ